MNEYIRIAWRNIWRNKRRTLITASSILFAVFFATVMRSFQLGSYGHWTKNVIKAYSGYIQIQQKDYWDDRTIDNTFEYTDELIQKVKDADGIINVVPRLESFALASTGEQTKGVLLIGIQPTIENEVTSLKDKLVKYKLSANAIERIKKDDRFPEAYKAELDNLEGKAYANIAHFGYNIQMPETDFDKYLPIVKEHSVYEGDYLAENDNGVLVSSKLAKFLQLEIGDTIVLLSQGYHGATAAGKYPIRGLLRFPSPDLDSRLIYMDLENAQELFSVGPNITSLALDLEKTSDKAIEASIMKISKAIDDENIVVKGWKDLNEEMVQQIEADNSGGIVMLTVLYVIIGFGILGTVLMMVAERKREFAVMIAVGMRRYKLNIILFFEMLYISLIGLVTGIGLAAPIIVFGHNNPVRLTGEMAEMMESYGIEAVMPMAWFDMYIVNQAIVVFILVIIAIIFPSISISKLNVIKAIRG